MQQGIEPRASAPHPPTSEAEALRRELARTAAERDMLLHLVLRTNSTGLGRMGRRWARYTARHPWAQRWISRPTRLIWLGLTLRWPAWLRVNPLFDEAWYREQYVDAPAGRRAAYRQYLRLSVTKGRDPNPHFDTDWYLERNPDVRGGHWHPLDHYLFFGWREARDPGPDFDGFDYLRHHPDAVEQAMNPLLHSMQRRGPAPGDPVDPFDPGGPRLPGPPPTVQRTLTHYRRYGARRTMARAASELGLVRSSFMTNGDAPVLEIAQHDARSIQAHLDSPREGASEASSALLVSGWAFSERAAEMLSVGIYLDTLPIAEATNGQQRPDVGAMYRRAAASGTSGFSARVDISGVAPGRHTLHVVMRAADGAVRIIARAFRRVEPEALYHHYYERTLATEGELALTRVAVKADGAPQVNVCILAGEDEDVQATLRSLEEQAYDGLHHVVLPVAAGFPPDEPDPTRLVGFVRAGERLAPGALWRFARALQEGADLVYSDHDSIEETGRHVDPWFVPDWAPDHLLAQDYVGGVFFARDTASLRRSLADVSGDTVETRYALLLRLAAERPRVRHIPSVLWSRPAWQTYDEGLAEREAAAVRAELGARGADAEVATSHLCPRTAIRHIAWPDTAHPLVSVIIPTTGRLGYVTAAMASLERTDYQPLEIVFLDNSRGQHPDGIAFLRGQDVTVLERDEPFNWAKLNNDGARVATGELLLFINDDVETDDPAWLAAMVRQATRSGVGAVGSLLRYPDGTIQHAGVFMVGHGGGAVHLFRGLDPGDHLYLDWHHAAREVTAVTGACMLVSREAFNEVGGFDEELAIIGNDVDLCLRLARTGRRVLMEPAAALIHHESRSRVGVDHFPDEGRMWQRWTSVLTDGDPHYNPNLSQTRVDAAPAWERVADVPPPILRVDRAAGVNLVGYIRAEMGLGEAIRGEAAALEAAGVPFVILDYQGGSPARMGDASWAHKVVENPVFDTNIIHVNADLLPQALGQLPAGLTRGRRNIGVWTWELPEFPAEWRGSFSLLDEVWVPSAFVRDAIGADAPVPVRVVPHAVRRSRGPFLGREHFGLPADAFQFLAMYDTQSVMERKNPQGAVEAFKRAFDADDQGVSLVLKVNSAGDREVGRLRDLVGSHANIHLVTDTLSRHAVDSLIACSDAFVSLHRSEGFGLPMAEAMAQGKPVIATGWSGNMDYMNESNAACVAYELVELERSYGPYKAGQRWAEPDLSDAADWMRRMRKDLSLRLSLGQAGKERVARAGDGAAIGGEIAARLGLDPVRFATWSRS